jgi:hypothetical protein
MMIRNEIQGGELWKLNKMGGGSTAAAPQKSIADFAPEARTHKNEKTDDKCVSFFTSQATKCTNSAPLVHYSCA